MNIYPEEPLFDPELNDSGFPIVAQTSRYNFGIFADPPPVLPLPSSAPWLQNGKVRQLMACYWQFEQDVELISEANEYTAERVYSYRKWVANPNSVNREAFFEWFPTILNSYHAQASGQFAGCFLPGNMINSTYTDFSVPNWWWIETERILIAEHVQASGLPDYFTVPNPLIAGSSIAYKRPPLFVNQVFRVYSVLYQVQVSYRHIYEYSMRHAPSIMPSLAGLGLLAALSGFITGVSPTPGRRPKKIF